MRRWEKKISIIASLFPRRAKEIGVVSTVLIIIISYSLFFYLQNITETNIKNTLFEQQRNRQMDSAKAMAQHISSDLQSIIYILQGLADTSYLQQGELSGDRVETLMHERFNQINSTTKVDGLFIADRDDITTYHLVREGQRSFVNIDISFRDYVQRARETLRPVYSNGFEGIDGIYRIALSYPIVNKEEGQYIGMVGVQIPTVDFFARYGNVYAINSQYLAALDRNATQLAHSNTQLIGMDFFGEYTQNFTRYNKDLNSLMKSVLAGKSGDVVYTIDLGERLTTGYPIFANGGGEALPAYVVFIVTPTSQIYSKIEDTLVVQRVETFTLLAITTAAAIILITFLLKWNSNLNTEVKRRTRELESAVGQLETANEQLKVHDNMQKEFINIAAHELRTPTQVITGYSELLATEPENQKVYLNPIIRNSKRLRRLAEDILDVTRIESHALKITEEEFDLNDVILSIVGDYKSLLVDKEDYIGLNIEYKPNSIIVNADKGRIAQVISNLLSNAIKFTSKEKGTVCVTAEKRGSEAIVAIKDTGPGISPTILPNLFSKFATRSESGTGLGLFISKSIIEAHGGKIWGENNVGIPGATFAFTLPLSDHKADS